MSEPTVPITNITPEKVSDEIEVVLVVSSTDRDGQPFVMAFVEAGHLDAEQSARLALGSYDHQRFATLARVRVPRALLRERWTEPK